MTDMEKRARELVDEFYESYNIDDHTDARDELIEMVEQAYRDGEMADHVRFAERTVKQVFEETRERCAKVSDEHCSVECENTWDKIRGLE